MAMPLRLVLVVAILAAALLYWTSAGGDSSAGSDGQPFVQASDADAAGRLLAYKRLLDWARPSGLQTLLEPVAIPGAGIGLRTTRAVAKNEAVLSLPHRLKLSSKSTDASKVHAALHTPEVKSLRAEGKWAERMDMVMLLVYERFYEQDSFWVPYFATLPADVSWHPAYWTESDLALAKTMPYTYFYVADVRSRVNLMVDLAWKAKQAAPAGLFPPSITQQTWKEQATWAEVMITSRAFGPRSDNDAAMTIAPFMDLLNHARGGARPKLVLETKDYVLQASEAVGKGAEILSSYGDYKCNLHLMAHYGFVIKQPEYHCVDYPLFKTSWPRHAMQLLPDEESKLRRMFKLFTQPIERSVQQALRLKLLAERPGATLASTRRGLYGLVDVQSECAVFDYLLEHFLATNETEWPHSRDGVALPLSWLVDMAELAEPGSVQAQLYWLRYGRLMSVAAGIQDLRSQWADLRAFKSRHGKEDWACDLSRTKAHNGVVYAQLTDEKDEL